MPKKKNRNKQNSMFDDDNLENASIISHCSSESDFVSIPPHEGVDNLLSATAMDKLMSAIDRLYEKRPDARIIALKEIEKIFRTNFLCVDDSWSQYETLLTGLENCMKKGKPEEQAIAANCLAVFSTQISQFENRCLVTRFQGLLESKFSDPAISCTFRSNCITALATVIFFGNCDDFASIMNVMTSLEAIYRNSCLKGDGKPPCHSESVLSLHCFAIRAWMLIYTTLPIFQANTLGRGMMVPLVSLLQSSSLDVRVAAGDCVCLIYERIRFEVDDTFKGPYFSSLINIFEKLAFDGTKAKSKNNLKIQRHTFRDILTFLKTDNFPYDQIVRVGSESLEIISYCHNFLYETFCLLLACGLNTHLQENEIIRSIFDLGPPIIKSSKTYTERTQNKASRHQANQFAFKLRTQKRGSHRDKRTAVVNDLDL